MATKKHGGAKQGAGKPAPKGDTTSTRRSDKRKAEMQASAILNGFETWSGMMTFIKNEALKGRAVIRGKHE